MSPQRSLRPLSIVAALATAAAVLTTAPAASAATDATAPTIHKARILPATIVLNNATATKVTVDVVATDNVAVTHVFALLYRGTSPETPTAALFIDGFTRIPGTRSSWRGVGYLDKGDAVGKYTLAVAALDAAGNVAETNAAGAVYVKRETRMPVFDATPEPVRKGASMKVGGRLTRLDPTRGYVSYGGATVKVFFKPVGGTWTYKATATTDSTGKWSRTFTASADGVWQARFAGTSYYAPRNSVEDYVDVR